MLLYAHRGNSVTAPENTLRAFELAVAAGAYGIEMDVRASVDGALVVIHDRNLQRTTSGLGNVDEMPLAAIRQADAGEGQSVPTLDEALDLISDRIRLDLEIKQPGIEHVVIDSLARHPEVKWVISSFDWSVLRRIRELTSAAELWPLSTETTASVIDVAQSLGSPCIAVNHRGITEKTMRGVEKAGLRIFAWTVNEPDEARRLQALGVYAVCTDDPKQILPALS
ncbi:MAG: glycerophosphodiester phosphodiesterase [Thermomicrobiales bacterium]